MAPCNIPAVRGHARKLVLAGLGILSLVAGISAVARRRPHQDDPLAAAANLHADELPLAVKHEGNAIRLFWAAKLPAVQNAASAELYILDGKHLSQINLNPGNLRSGSAVYWPETDKEDIAFRLELTLPDRRVTRSIVASAAHREPAAPVTQVASTVAPAARVMEQVESLPRGGIRHFVDRTVRQPVEARVHETEPPKPSPFTAPPPAHATVGSADRAGLAPSPAPPAIPHAISGVKVRAEPLPPSLVSRAIGKVPLLRRIRKNRGAVVARALHEVRPQPLPAQRGLRTPVFIDVRIDLNEAGKVTSAKADSLNRHTDFAAAAIEAALRWQFTPARIGDENVPAKAILHFQFDPTFR